MNNSNSIQCPCSNVKQKLKLHKISTIAQSNSVHTLPFRVEFINFFLHMFTVCSVKVTSISKLDKNVWVGEVCFFYNNFSTHLDPFH